MLRSACLSSNGGGRRLCRLGADPALDDAHAAVERAQRPARARLGRGRVGQAEIALEQAGFAARAGAPPAEVEHLAYVASQRAAFAEARAAAQVARSETRLLRRALGPNAIEAIGGSAGRGRCRDRVGCYPLPRRMTDSPSLRQLIRPPAAAPDAMAAHVATLPQDIPLSLAQLPFDQAEPTAEALAELAGLAVTAVSRGGVLLIKPSSTCPSPRRAH